MSIALCVPQTPKAILLHPVSFNYNVATDLNVRLFAAYPDVLRDVTGIRDARAQYPNGPDVHASRLEPTVLSQCLLHLFCVGDDGTLERYAFLQQLRSVRDKYPGRDVHVPVKLGFLRMSDEEWSFVTDSVNDILGKGPNPCRIHIWDY